MNTKERCEALGRLADAAWRDFDTRRSYEWKANFGLWTALGALAGFTWDKDVPDLGRVLGYAALVTLVGVYVFLWTRGLFNRNYIDFHNYLFFQREVEYTIEVRGGPFHKGYRAHTRPPLGFLRNWSHGSQISVTVVLALLAALALTVGEAPETAVNPAPPPAVSTP